VTVSLFSLSKAELAEACPASCALPGVSSSSTAAHRGTALHRYVVRALAVGSDAALAEVPEDDRELCAQYVLTGLPSDPGAYACEVAFAIDRATGRARLLGLDIGRDYAGAAERLGQPLRPTEVCGSADFVTLLGGDGVGVDDLKTGWSRVTAAERNLQLGALAYASAQVYGRDWADVRLLVRREDGSGYFSRARLDSFALDGVLLRLRRAAEGVRQAREDVSAGRVPKMSEGTWCRFCPAQWGCPAKTTLIRTLAMAPQTVLENQVSEQLTPETARAAYERLKVIKGVLGVVEGSLRSYVEEHPIDLGDGYVYGRRPIIRKVIDGHKAYSIIYELHGAAVAASACDMETSQAAIERALRPVAPARGLKALKTALLERLDSEGGITTETAWKTDEHRAATDGMEG